MFEPGSTVLDFEIVRKVKDGGMATLYLAQRGGARGFTRPVAIKVMHPHLAGKGDFVQMFVDEAMLGSHLSHPNIVHVEQFGEHEGTAFLVMEYVDGCSLSELMRFLRTNRRRLKPQVAIHIGIKVAEALHAAHEATDADGRSLGVVHRDVSPGNVLLSRKGHVKVIDFGIAKSEVRTTETSGSLKGKIRYMSPEQAFGKSLDRRTDVYSLGLVVWELVTGRRVFRAPRDMALLDMVRDPSIHPPGKYASIPGALDEAILKALWPEPENRYENAREFRRALVKAMPDAVALEAIEIAGLVRAVPPFSGQSSGSTSGSASMKSNLEEVSRASNLPPPAPPVVLAAAPDSDEGDHADTVVAPPGHIPTPESLNSPEHTGATARLPRKVLPWQWVAGLGVGAVLIGVGLAVAAGGGGDEPEGEITVGAPTEAAAAGSSSAEGSGPEGEASEAETEAASSDEAGNPEEAAPEEVAEAPTPSPMTAMGGRAPRYIPPRFRNSTRMDPTVSVMEEVAPEEPPEQRVRGVLLATDEVDDSRPTMGRRGAETVRVGMTVLADGDDDGPVRRQNRSMRNNSVRAQDTLLADPGD
ncbi:MAG: serine/threonine-protein kinase [Myxococcota bacterium]